MSRSYKEGDGEVPNDYFNSRQVVSYTSTACFMLTLDRLSVASQFKATNPDWEVICFLLDSADAPHLVDSTVDIREYVDDERVDLELARAGNIEYLEDWTGQDFPSLVNRVRRLLYSVKNGGTYRIRGVDHTKHRADRFSLILESKSDYAQKTDSADYIHKNDRSFIAAISKVSIESSGWSIIKSGQHLVRIRESEANAILPWAFGGDWGCILEARSGAETPLPSSCHMHNRKRPHHDLDSIGAVPPLFVREYHNVLVAPRQILIKGEFFLPDTFRLHMHPRLNHDLLEYVSSTRSRVPDAVVDAPHVEGDYYYIDTIYPGHFGHVMTEVLGRLWGWDAAKKKYPKLKALLSVRTEGDTVPQFEIELLEAYGIKREDIFCLKAPLRVDRVIAATPMFHNTRYVSPDIRSEWLRIKRGMGVDNESGKGRRIFISRAMSRGCLNGAEVEAAFRYSGFDIVRPEKHTMQEQIRMFSQASVVAGYAGSGMFTAMFSERPLTKIVISQEAYNAVNEHLQSGISGDDIHYFWCEPTIEHPPGEWLLAAFRSNFYFDFVESGDELYSLLDGL